MMPAGDCYIVAGGILGLDAEGFAEVGLGLWFINEKADTVEGITERLGLPRISNHRVTAATQMSHAVYYKGSCD